jgi:hypothetical protein
LSSAQELTEPQDFEPRLKKYSLPPRVDRAKFDRVSDVPDLNSSRSKYAAWQSRIATVAEQMQIVEG